MIIGVRIRIVGVESGTAQAGNHTLWHHHFDDAEVLGMRPACAQALAHNLLEGEAEIATKQGVDARINGRIAIAQPEQDGEQNGWNALRTECPDDVHREKWHPAHDETAHNDACIKRNEFNPPIY